MLTLEFNVTPERFNKKLSEAKLPIVNNGTGSYKGVTINYTYDGSNKLVLQIIKKPLFVKESYIESKITDWLIN